MTSPTDAEAARVRRPTPRRAKPDRKGWSGDAPSGGADTSTTVAGFENPEIEKIVTDTVRIGYSVIGDNLRQGRAAADRFGAGTYKPGDVTGDLGQMGRRLMDAARDLSVIWFDFLQAALRDPRLAAALQPQPIAPSPPSGGSSGAQVDVPLVCTFPGKAATVVQAQLSRPAQPTILTTAGLHTATGSEPPITTVTFLAAAGGGVTAVVRIPADQPAGTYSGVISDAGSHAPLGMLAVKVDQ
jgi:hypothetical protein